jgi:hypothetical protein
MLPDSSTDAGGSLSGPPAPAHRLRAADKVAAIAPTRQAGRVELSASLRSLPNQREAVLDTSLLCDPGTTAAVSPKMVSALRTPRLVVAALLCALACAQTDTFSCTFPNATGTTSLTLTISTAVRDQPFLIALAQSGSSITLSGGSCFAADDGSVVCRSGCGDCLDISVYQQANIYQPSYGFSVSYKSSNNYAVFAGAGLQCSKPCSSIPGSAYICSTSGQSGRHSTASYTL